MPSAGPRQCRAGGRTPGPVVALLAALLFTAGLAACESTPTPTPSALPSATEANVAPSAPAMSQPPAVSAAPSSSATPKPSVADALDACALTSRDDLVKIVGPKLLVGTNMPATSWIAAQCAWNSPKGGFIIAVGTADSISAAGDPSTSDAKAQFEAFKSSMSGAKEVAGIGDGAVIGPIGIGAYKGDTYLQITNLGLTEAQLIEILKLAVAKV